VFTFTLISLCKVPGVEQKIELNKISLFLLSVSGSEVSTITENKVRIIKAAKIRFMKPSATVTLQNQNL
jgi:hypothetical protein